MSSNTLYLPLKKNWFDMIKAGIKKKNTAKFLNIGLNVFAVRLRLFTELCFALAWK